MNSINNLRVAVIATDGVEEPEIVKPIEALRNAGAHVEILSIKPGEIQCFNHHDKGSKLNVDKIVGDVRPDDYDALLLPGGALNADTLRIDRNVKRFVESFDKDKKPIAFICHAPWILVSTNIVRDRTLTSFETIEDDIRNAGGHWVDHEVCCDYNWISSRKPADIPAFNREMINTFAEFGAKNASAA